ncbi:peptidyl-tRNA hydrolase [Cladorrhinum sp. PSN259]|nr:peptidyl-tRNA hydrolase [Cladorrhinum sp. PSN259]
MASIRRFLVISLGNPGAAYRDTYHSAGHNVLNGLQKLISAEQPAFTSERHGKKSTLASIGPRYSLIQSPAIMNVSGPWVSKTYREHLVYMGLQPSELGVVLVHDDLEEDLGVVKLRNWARSHRGHNGVKSVNASLQVPQDLTAKWGRISVGIGRPSERDQTTVADFVLSKMSKHTKEVLEEKGSRGALSALLELEGKNRKLEGGS